ncbi:putative F-box domain-containing protein [Tanacetum coccineum]
MAISLPQDVFLFNILPRLPAKSIPRFMCVSKQLYSFLSSDVFQKMLARHLDHHQNPEKLLVVSGTSPHMFETFDCEAPASGLAPSCFRLPFDAEALAKTTTNLTGLKETCIQLWKMVEDGCWNNVVTYHVDRYHIRSLTPLHLMRNGKLLMLDNVGSALYEVDLVKEKHSKGKEKWWRNAPRALYEVVLKKKQLSKKKDEWCKLISMGVSDQVRYTETFVSPNLYIK